MTVPFRLIVCDDDIAKPPHQLRIGDVVSQYLTARKIEQDLQVISDRRYETLSRYLRIFTEDFSRLGTNRRQGFVSECERSDLMAWLRLREEWVSGYTRQDATASVVSCFRWAEDERLIDRTPYKRPKFLGKLLKPRPAILPEEYRAMMVNARRALTKGGHDAKRQRPRRTIVAFRSAMIFLWFTGARVCEMREALWTELDWSRGIIVMHGKTTAATGTERVIPVRRVLRLLRWLYRSRKKGQETIFANTLGRPWTRGVFGKEFRRYADLAKVRKKVSAYCLRHALITRLLESGLSERAVADVAGQKTTRYIEHYSRVLRTKADYLNDVLESE